VVDLLCTLFDGVEEVQCQSEAVHCKILEGDNLVTWGYGYGGTSGRFIKRRRGVVGGG